jgi:hypothetical protein
MLRFLVLSLRGSNSQQDIQERLNLCMLDPDEARKMSEESDINNLIDKYSSRLKLAGALAGDSPKA